MKSLWLRVEAMQFHLFVVLATISFYLLLRQFKNDVEKHKRSSRLIYILFVPALLYVSYYLCNAGTEIKPTALPVSENVMKAVSIIRAPSSSSSSSASTASTTSPFPATSTA